MNKKEHKDISQNSLFYVPQKKVSHTILEQHDGEQMMKEYSFSAEQKKAIRV